MSIKKSGIWVLNMMKNLNILLILLLLFGAVFASAYTVMNSSGTGVTQIAQPTIQVIKNSSENGTLGQDITIQITVKNIGSSNVDGYVIEEVGNYDVVGHEVQRINIANESMLAARAPQIIWNLSINAGETKVFSYTIRPKTVGLLTIGPTEVVSANSAFRSNSLIISIACSDGNACDERLGETPLTCPMKCGGNATVAPADAPNLSYIPTPAISNQIPTPTSQQPPKADVDRVEMMTNLLYGGIVVLVLVFAFVIYKKLANKKV